jgi:hypothetical protein
MYFYIAPGLPIFALILTCSLITAPLYAFVSPSLEKCFLKWKKGREERGNYRHREKERNKERERKLQAQKNREGAEQRERREGQERKRK